MSRFRKALLAGVGAAALVAGSVIAQDNVETHEQIAPTPSMEGGADAAAPAGGDAAPDASADGERRVFEQTSPTPSMAGDGAAEVDDAQEDERILPNQGTDPGVLPNPSPADEAPGEVDPTAPANTGAATDGGTIPADQPLPEGLTLPAEEGSDDEAAAHDHGAHEVPAEEAGLGLGLGRLATEDEVAAWDIDIRPDGQGLPVGSGTVLEGMDVYDAQCASCHGDFGEAIGRWPVLAGGQGTLDHERPEKTIGSFWPYLSTTYDYVRRTMPFGYAQSLSDDEVYALTAYLLYLNDIVLDEDFELSDENFAEIELPNVDGFVDDDRESEPHYATDLEPCMSDCIEGAATITMHAAVLDVTPDGEGEGGGID